VYLKKEGEEGEELRGDLGLINGVLRIGLLWY
jgi:hypothetical protein